MKIRNTSLLLIALAMAALGTWACSSDGVDTTVILTRSDGPTGNAGVVSSSAELATLAGVEMLEAGGNAFDAAVAVASTLTVVQPTHSSIFGGYGTIIIYDAEQNRLRYLDNGGRFPKAVNSDVFREATDRRQIMMTAKGVSTPGNLSGFEAMSKEHGSKPWADLFESAIRLADEGIDVTEGLARSISRTWENLSDYSKDFYGASGEPLQAGDTLVQRDLAESFRMAAREGAKALYGGELGRALDAEMKRQDGFLAMEDLVEHESDWFDPIQIDYRGNQVVTAGPPANSFVSLVCLGIMSRYDNKALGHNTGPYLHRFAEATKHAFWARLKYAGGPEVNPPPLDRLLSEGYWQEQVDRFDDEKASTFVPPSEPTEEGSDTTHFAVADRWGNVVSATITLGGLGFGSAVMVEGTGIWLNNSLSFCTFEPKGNPMDALPGNRKHASMSPTMITKNGRVWAAFGMGGGHTIPQTVPQIAINLIDFEMDLETAAGAPRISFGAPDRLQVSEGVPETVRKELEALGHNLRVRGGDSTAQSLMIEYDGDGKPVRFIGAASRGGVAMGVNREGEEGN